jgi:hypothetical protein
MKKNKVKMKMDEAEKELPIQKDWWAIGYQAHSCQTNFRQHRFPLYNQL